MRNKLSEFYTMSVSEAIFIARISSTYSYLPICHLLRAAWECWRPAPFVSKPFCLNMGILKRYLYSQPLSFFPSVAGKMSAMITQIDK